jgi:3-(3-hydroxy-phenyl)propionate hydroxylase
MHVPHSTHTRSLYFDYPIYPFRTPAEMAGRAATHPVAIVGGGPVGLITAIELARRGVPVVVIEAAETVSEGSRAACVSRRSMEILQQNGADGPFMARALPWIYGTSYYRDHPVYRLEMPHSQDERFHPMANLQQNFFELLLVERAAMLPGIDLRWQSKVTGIAQDEHGVTLDVDTPEGGYRLRARYVVAADGARSEVRQLMGVRLNGESHSGRYLIADIRMASSYPTERRAWFDPPSNPRCTVLMHKQPEDIWRIDYQLAADQDETVELQEARVRSRIQCHLDYIGERTPWELEWISLYKAHCLCLDRYREGRVIFAGDAAHLVPIFGVRGLNSGVADANNLGWKLAYVVHGLAPDRILDSYTPERRGATLDIFENARKSTIFMTPPTRGFELVRDAALQLAVTETFTKPLVNPRQSMPYDYVDSPLTTRDADDAAFDGGPRPGAPLANVRLALSDADGAFLLDHLGTDFTLLAFGSDAQAARGLLAALPALHRDRVRILLVGGAGTGDASTTSIDDADGRVTSRYGARAGAAYLARPDGHVAARWMRPTPALVAAALLRACGAKEN